MYTWSTPYGIRRDLAAKAETRHPKLAEVNRSGLQIDHVNTVEVLHWYLVVLWSYSTSWFRLLSTRNSEPSGSTHSPSHMITILMA